MTQRSWNYQERWRTFPLSVKNTTISSTLRIKQKNQTTQLGLSRMLENISSIRQQYYNLFNFKEAKESNNAAGIIKNAGEHFFCQSRILQPLPLQLSKRMKQRSWNCQEAGKHFLCQSRILQSPQLQGSKRMKQRSWNYQEGWRTPQLQESKQMNNVAGITKNLANISSVSQQYYNLFNFKEAKE